MSSDSHSVIERHAASPACKETADTNALRSDVMTTSTVSDSEHKNYTTHNHKDEGHQDLPTVEHQSRLQPDMPSMSISQPLGPNTVSLSSYLKDSISPTSHWTSNLLLGLGLATGINDAATFIDYHLFVSNQTGNTVFLGIGALNHDTIFDLRHVGLSLGLFLAGGLISGQVANHVAGKRARWWIVFSNAVQTALMAAAAALRQWYATHKDMRETHSDPKTYSVISLLAFASGMQVAMARELGVLEIPTGMITSAWIDLVIDDKLWHVWRRDPSRDRRLGFVLCILLGGFIGAAASVYCAPALPLLLTACVKACVTIGFALGKGEGSVKGRKGYANGSERWGQGENA